MVPYVVAQSRRSAKLGPHSGPVFIEVATPQSSILFASEPVEELCIIICWVYFGSSKLIASSLTIANRATADDVMSDNIMIIVMSLDD
jgi:hypothetical protein